MELWGAFIGLAVAAAFTWAVSYFVWGEFNGSLFTAMGLPAVLIGVYLQHKVENKN